MPAQQVLRIFFFCCPVKLIMWSKTGFLARLVHFLLWQAAKPSGDKCTP